MPRVIKLGSRASRLALFQAELVKDALNKLGHEVVIIPSVSLGDTLPGPLYQYGGKGLFSAELDRAILSGEIDFAIHSAKDIPGDYDDRIALQSVLGRAPISDSLLCKDGQGWESLKDGSKIGTSSIRRARQLMLANNKFEILPLRGNIETRINKLKTGEFDAIILASAALARLNILGAKELPTNLLPALTQGCLALSTAKVNPELIEIANKLSLAENEACFICERAFLKALKGDCTTPIAGRCTIKGQQITLEVELFARFSAETIKLSGTKSVALGQALGAELATEMLQQLPQNWQQKY